MLCVQAATPKGDNVRRERRGERAREREKISLFDTDNIEYDGG